MKRAFTLAEAIITLSVIGIIAALTIPLVSRSAPDEIKLKYLKVYDTLAETVKTIAANEELYGPIYDPGNQTLKNDDNEDIPIAYDVENYPLLNYTEPTDNIHNTSGKTKFCELLKEALSSKDFENCSDSSAEDGNFNDNYNFETINGTAWYVAAPQGSGVPADKDTDGSFYIPVIVDINGIENGPNAEYNENSSSTIPDRYKFYINAKGSIIPADPYGQLYIATRRSASRNNTSLSSYSVVKPENITTSIRIPKEILLNADTKQPLQE